MKYFEYISEAKLQMLFNQVPPTVFDLVSYSTSINLGFFEINLGRQSRPAESREEKVAALENHLREEQLLKDYTEEALLCEYSGRCVFFRSSIEEGLTLIAGGAPESGFLVFCSTANFLGNSGLKPPEGELAFSFEPRALRTLAEIVEDENQRDRPEMNLQTFGSLSDSHGMHFGADNYWKDFFGELIWNHDEKFLVCNNRIVFRRLRTQSHERPYLAIGTPIWIEAI